MSLPSVSDLDAVEADPLGALWGDAAADLGSRNFVAEVFAEDRAERAERGENWLDLPKEGFATGRAWAEPRNAALDKDIEQARVRGQQLYDAYVERVHILTDADMAGRWMNGDSSKVQQELRGASRAHSRALGHIHRAQAHNDLPLDLPEYEQRQQVARGALMDALGALEQEG